MKRLKQYKYIILVSLVLGFAFYWYSYRPQQIVKECLIQARKLASDVVLSEQKLQESGFPITKLADYDQLLNERFSNCKLEHGIER